MTDSKIVLFSIDPEVFLQQIRAIIKTEITGMQIPSKTGEADAIDPDTINIAEAAKITGYAKKYLYTLADKKAIPHLKIGKGSVRFSRKELENWMHSGRPNIHQEAIDNLANNYIVNGKK